MHHGFVGLGVGYKKVGFEKDSIPSFSNVLHWVFGLGKIFNNKDAPHWSERKFKFKYDHSKTNLVRKSEDSLHDISEAFFNLVLQRIASKKKNTEKK